LWRPATGNNELIVEYFSTIDNCLCLFEVGWDAGIFAKQYFFYPRIFGVKYLPSAARRLVFSLVSFYPQIMFELDFENV